MKVVIYSDAQYYMNSNKSKLLSSGITSWAQMQLDLTEDIFKFAQEKDVDFVIHNGDLFEQKSNINVPLYNAVWEFYRDWSKKLKKIVLNTGNHDLYLLKESALKPFSDICVVIDDAYFDLNIGIIPYGQFNKIDFSGRVEDILFTHETYDVLFDFDDPKKVEYEKIKDFKYVFNGHIHQPMTYKNLVNIGSINVNDWGEVGGRRFIYFDTNDYVSVEINCPKFIELESLEDIDKINDRDFFRIPISKSDRSHDIFKLYNVFPNISKMEERECRIETKVTDEELINQYVDIFPDSALDSKKLKKIGKRYINDNFS